ncbi:MAG: sugar porter family MFS transporter [Akkermansiaceae bacterium]|nr:sugar porter family MFS transporter [Akkermansiaceae bacterium]
MTPPPSSSKLYLLSACLVATLGGMLFGYDTGVINGSLQFVEARFSLDAGMKGFAASSALLACIPGAILAGFFGDWLGRRKTLMISGLLFLISAIGTAVPNDINTFIIFRIIGGIGVGAASMTSPMYIAEIAPARIRGRLVSLNQLAIVGGMLVVYFVNYFITNPDDMAWNTATGWRWMFGSEALPAAGLFLLTFFIPETPRWLSMHGRKNEARAVLVKIEGEETADEEMRAIETSLNEEKAGLSQLFTPGHFKLLALGLTLAFLQQATGINVFLYFGSEIFGSLGGEKIDAALLQQVIVGGANVLFTLVAIWTVDIIGRKPLMITGAAGMGLSLFVMGTAGAQGEADSSLLLWVIVYIASFALSLGPVVWVLLSEIFPNKIRSLAMATCTVFLWLTNSVVSQTFVMMDKNEALVEKYNHGFPFFIYGGLCIVTILFVLICLPETKGRSLEENK